MKKFIRSATAFGTPLALMAVLAAAPTRLNAAEAPAPPPKTDDQVATEAKLAPPPAWAFPPQSPLHVLAVRGLWYDMYNLNGALLKTGVDERDCWHSRDGLHYYINGYEELENFNLVILCNINAGSMGPVERVMLREYVRNGGSVLCLGGNYGFLDYQGTALGEIVPVTFPNKAEAVQAPNGLTLAAAPGDDLGLGKLAWGQAPRVFWHQEITPKAGAKVEVTGDGKPLLVTGTFGKGRVAVFAGTVMGEPATGQLPFWEWSDWKDVLSGTIEWLTAPTRKTDPKADSDLRDAINAGITQAGGKTAGEEAVLARYAPMCPDKETAELLLRTAREGGADISYDTANTIETATAPFIDGKDVGLASALIASSKSHKAALGFQILAHAHAPNALAILQKALTTGDLDAPADDAPDDLGGGGGDAGSGSDTEDPTDRRNTIRLGAIAGLGILGDPAAVPLLQKVMAEFKAAGTKGFDTSPDVTPERELYAAAAIAAVRCGDKSAAPACVTAMIYQRYLLFHLVGMADQVVEGFGSQRTNTELTKRLAQENITRQVIRERRLLGRLANLPEPVLAPLAEAVVAETRPCTEGLTLAAFSGRTLPAGVAATLSKSHNSIVAAMFDGKG